MRYNERDHAGKRIAVVALNLYRKGVTSMNDENLTPDEQEIEDEAGVDGEEAHRIGEFDDLRDRLERIEGMLSGIAETLEGMRTTTEAIDIDNGATVVDVDGDEDADIIKDEVDVIPDFDELDLDF